MDEVTEEFAMESEDNESESEFAFETDHLALRQNRDYCELLKYIVTLESKKQNVLRDIEELGQARSKALADPVQFVQDLKAGLVQFPPRQTIQDLPKIDWDKYEIDSTLETEDMRESDKDDNVVKVRGRAFTDSKPETFNQLWTVEEQKRLEELLEIYPEEPRRFKKIAEALGTRTQHQVISRIQKYFAKLAKAGLPIPGRAPKGSGPIKDRNRQILYKKSTFFSRLHVPVQMDDDPYDSNDIPEASTSESCGNKAMIDMLKAAKEQRLMDEKFPVWQTNTICVGCQKSGFLGARWTDNAGTDYCTDCFVKLLPVEKLVPIRDVN